MTLISNNIEKAAEVLSRDELVAIPTETVYGLAGNIYSNTAIKKIFELKKRPFFNPLIVHIHSMEQVLELVTEVPEKAKQLAQKFWPGPLTLILKKQPTVPDIITAGNDTVAIRMPAHELTLKLLKKLSFPLAAPSANPFTCISPTSVQHVKDYFNNQLEMILNGGDCKNGIESTIVGFEKDEAIIYRLGAISLEDITAVIGEVTIKTREENAPQAPGMLEKHYAPRTKTVLITDINDFIKEHSQKKIGLLLHNSSIESYDVMHVYYLSKTGNLNEAAANLYRLLHELDQLELDMIVVQRLPDTGLGKSINDRLQRASK